MAWHRHQSSENKLSASPRRKHGETRRRRSISRRKKPRKKMAGEEEKPIVCDVCCCSGDSGMAAAKRHQRNQKTHQRRQRKYIYRKHGVAYGKIKQLRRGVAGVQSAKSVAASMALKSKQHRVVHIKAAHGINAKAAAPRTARCSRGGAP